MRKEFTIEIEKDEEGWFVGEVVELPGCHSQAKSKDELLTRLSEAVRGYLEENIEPVFNEQKIILN